MTALPQYRSREPQPAAAQSRVRKVGTTAIFLLTTALSILLALVFGADVWRIVLASVLLVILIACLVLIALSTASFLRDDS